MNTFRKLLKGTFIALRVAGCAVTIAFHGPVIVKAIPTQVGFSNLTSFSSSTTETITRNRRTTKMTYSIRKIVLAAATAATLFVGVSTAANAGNGFLGGIIEDICGQCGVGDTLDELNDEWDNPVDHAIAGVCEAYIPGCGVAIEEGYKYNREGLDGVLEDFIIGDDQ